jgi:hypothetical protein
MIRFSAQLSSLLTGNLFVSSVRQTNAGVMPPSYSYLLSVHDHLFVSFDAVSSVLLEQAC